MFSPDYFSKLRHCLASRLPKWAEQKVWNQARGRPRGWEPLYEPPCCMKSLKLAHSPSATPLKRCRLAIRYLQPNKVTNDNSTYGAIFLQTACFIHVYFTEQSCISKCSGVFTSTERIQLRPPPQNNKPGRRKRGQIIVPIKLPHDTLP